MKRLIKKSDHDILNRDAAIVYCNGKIYTGVTHAYCLGLIKEDFDLDMIMRSYQMRPDYDQFIEISKTVGPVVLAHCVKKEEGVFVDLGFFDGEAREFNDIPSKYLKELEAEFDMPVYDEMKHDMDIYKDPESNPYKDDKDEIIKKLDKDINEMGGPDNGEEVERLLETKGFTYMRGDLSYYNNDEGVFVEVNQTCSEVGQIGCKIVRHQNRDVLNVINNLPTNPFLEKIKYYVDDYTIQYVGDYSFELEFKNNNNLDIVIQCQEDYMDVLVDSVNVQEIDDLLGQFPGGYFNYEDSMDALMNYNKSQEEENKTEEEEDLNLNDDDFDIDWSEIDTMLDSFEF